MGALFPSVTKQNFQNSHVSKQNIYYVKYLYNKSLNENGLFTIFLEQMVRKY